MWPRLAWAMRKGVRRAAPLCLAAALWPACGPSTGDAPSQAASQLATTSVTLPDGAVIQAELAVTPQEQARGLMYRAELAEDRGMLFIGTRSSRRSFWMYRCLIPLDMVWMDGAHRIVEIVPNAPPCASDDPSACPSYGGTANSVYVLELAAGQAEAHGLEIGERIEF